MFKFSAVSQIWKKYIQKLNDWDLPLTDGNNALLIFPRSVNDLYWKGILENFAENW